MLSSRLPLFIGAVLGLSFLLLLVVFRSIVVPLKAVIMNLLSIAAAYGVIVAVFQWGWLSDVFGVGKPGPIEAWAPMMLFAIVFGLSMDYEVFLLSRIKEEYDGTGDNGQAVADGLASTARVITAAAAIMICVFGSFVLGDQRQIKLIGLGLARGCLDRRDGRAHGVGAGDDGAARRPQLVVPEVARSHRAPGLGREPRPRPRARRAHLGRRVRAHGPAHGPLIPGRSATSCRHRRRRPHRRRTRLRRTHSHPKTTVCSRTTCRSRSSRSLRSSSRTPAR